MRSLNLRKFFSSLKSGKISLSFLFYLLVFTFLAAQAATDIKGLESDLKKQKEELKSLKTRLFEEKQKLNKLVKTKSGVLKKIDKIADNIDLINKYIHKLEASSLVLNKSREKTDSELKKLKQQIDQRNNIIGKRMRKTFIAGKDDFLLYNLLPKNDMDFFKRLFYVRRLIEYDRSILKAARIDEEKKIALAEQLGKKITEIESFKKTKSREITVYSKEQKDLGIKMTELQNNEDTQRIALEDIKKNEKALEKIIKVLEKKRKDELAKNHLQPQFNLKGKFCSPVQGSLITKYGNQYHSTLKTMTKNLGVEYLGALGEPVLSAAEGEVVYVDDIPGYGKGIIIYNGSGYYNIYGNLSSIQVKEGDKIKGCQEIAEIPPSGANSRRKIYFEVRKEKVPLNPVEWLKTMIN